MIKAIIFDMDGLMFDTEALNAEGWKVVGKRHGFEMTGELLREYIGANLRHAKQLMMNRFGPEFDFDTIRGERIDYALKHIEANGTPLKPGLKELLAYLKANGIKSALATSSDERFVLFYMQHADIDHTFDAVVTGDKVQNGKPAPDIFLAALAGLESFGVKADECLVLEDSYNGITAAHRAGIRTVMVPDLLPPTPEMEKLFFRKADTLADVIPIIESLENE